MSSADQLIDELGLIFQESGAPRISGRIFALLLVEGEALSLHQISERLDVSRASVSTNARTLCRQGLLKRTTRSGDRQDYYELDGFPYTDMFGELAAQYRRFAGRIGAGATAIRANNPKAASRVDTLADLYIQVATILESPSPKLGEHGSHKDRT